MGNILDRDKSVVNCWRSNVDSLDSASFTGRSIDESLLESVNATSIFMYADFGCVEIIGDVIQVHIDT